MEKTTEIKKKKKSLHLSKKAKIVLISIAVAIVAIVGGILIWLYCGDKVCTYCGRNTFSDKIYRDGTVVCCEFCYSDMFEETDVDPKEYYNKKAEEPEFTKLESSIYIATSGKAKAGEAMPRIDFLKVLAKFYVIDELSVEEWATGIDLLLDNESNELERGITREEAAAYLGRYMMITGITTANDGNEKYSDDADISDWAKEHVYALRSLGVMDAASGSDFKPSAVMTRAEAAELLIDFVEATGIDKIDYSEIKIAMNAKIEEKAKAAEEAARIAAEEAAAEETEEETTEEA